MCSSAELRLPVAILARLGGRLGGPHLRSTDFRLGSNYRTALEEEIRSVVRSSEWTWYVEGEHYRELEFVHLAAQREWRVGALDLYRPDTPNAVIVDFKTHEVGEVEKAAEASRVQATVYRDAAGVRGDVDVRLHFTRGNVTWPMEGS
jgi:hypothetical protein